MKQQNDDLNNSSSSPYIGNGPARDLTLERIVEAEQISELKSGDNAIPYLRVVGSNTMVPPEFKVTDATLTLVELNSKQNSFHVTGSRLINMCNGK